MSTSGTEGKWICAVGGGLVLVFSETLCDFQGNSRGFGCVAHSLLWGDRVYVKESSEFSLTSTLMTAFRAEKSSELEERSGRSVTGHQGFNKRDVNNNITVQKLIKHIRV